MHIFTVEKIKKHKYIDSYKEIKQRSKYSHTVPTPT